MLKLTHIKKLSTAVVLTLAAAIPFSSLAQSQQPNIIIIMTDDQGYGDVGINQNPVINTPNINQLAGESVSFSNFHMDPTCSPSRSSLLTGQYSMRAGVWHTIMGRSLLPTEHVTLAESLQSAGYKTAMFGKWHLGDNYPFRPEDQGFEQTLIHGGGGVGQTPDYWGNTQFGDTYFRNGKAERFDDYATNVWFDEALNFIDENKDSEQPFFAYISTNAPHSPWRAPDAYVKQYLDKGLPKKLALYYAMITHLDDQVGRLRAKLESEGISDNTLLIFTTDNGSTMNSKRKEAFGKAGFDSFFADITKKQQYKDWLYNAGMKGYKASVYEGGHRVPLYIHWPDGGLGKARSLDNLTAHIDLMPTLLDAAKAEKSSAVVDGASLLPLLQQGKTLKPRTMFVTNQRVDIPSKDRPTVVMTDRWRYVLHGEHNLVELFDIQKDPGQKVNVKEQFPKVAKQLQAKFEQWWGSVTSNGTKRQRIIVGSEHENPARLTGMDWMEAKSEREVPWFPGFSRPQDAFEGASWMGRETKFPRLPWYLAVEQSAQYQIALYLKDKPASHPIDRKFAILEIDGKRQVLPVTKLANGVNFERALNKGHIKLKGWFADDEAGEKNVVPAFYAYLTRK